MTQNDFYLVDEAASANLTDTASMPDVIPEIWSRDVLRVFEDNLVVSQIARRIELQEGDVFHIPKYVNDTITVDSHTEGADITVSQLTTDVVTVTPGLKGARIEVSQEQLNRAFTGLDLLSYASGELGRTLAEKVEDDVIGELETEYTISALAAQIIDNTASAITATLIKAAFSSAKTKFTVANVPGPFVCVMRPEEYELLLNDTQFVDSSQFGGSEAVRNGMIATYKGFDIVLSNRLRASGDLDSDSTGDFDMWFATAAGGLNAAVAMGVLASPRIEIAKEIASQNYDIVATIDFGVQLQRSESAIRHTFKPAA